MDTPTTNSPPAASSEDVLGAVVGAVKENILTGPPIPPANNPTPPATPAAPEIQRLVKNDGVPATNKDGTLKRGPGRPKGPAKKPGNPPPVDSPAPKPGTPPVIKVPGQATPEEVAEADRKKAINANAETIGELYVRGLQKFAGWWGGKHLPYESRPDFDERGIIKKLVMDRVKEAEIEVLPSGSDLLATSGMYFAPALETDKGKKRVASVANRLGGFVGSIKRKFTKSS